MLNNKLHVLIGNAANYATLEEGNELLRIVEDNDARFSAIKTDKRRFNTLLERIKWRERGWRK